MTPAFRTALLTASLAFGAAQLPATAFASHYQLDDVTFVAPSVRDALERWELHSTRDLLLNVATTSDRAAIAQSSGLAYDELTELARVCDLLQIPGIGPKVAQLLIASGVRSSEDLASRDVEALASTLWSVNQIEAYTSVQPEPEFIAAWVHEAAFVVVRVEY